MNIGYARVSTQGETLESQHEELGKAGCAKIYREVASGARSDRPQLHNLLKGLEPGSTLALLWQISANCGCDGIPKSVFR